jgi:hypothetical protein
LTPGGDVGAYFGVLTSKEGAMNVRRLIACILLPSYLVACTTWKTQEASPQQVIAEEPDKVRVTLTDGSQVEVFQPVVSGDTLRGFDSEDRTSRGATQGDEVSIPLADVSTVETRGTDALLTTAFVFGTVVVVAAIALNVAVAIYCDSPIGC